MWGSPWQPEFCDWAFNLPRGAACLDVWKQIPTNVNLLITHGPPLGRGDRVNNGLSHCGCVDLLREVQDRVKPAVHIFGHVHEGYGVSSDSNTTFINASSCTLQYQCINPPIVFDLYVAPDGSVSEPFFIRSRLLDWTPLQVGHWLAEHPQFSALPLDDQNTDRWDSSVCAALSHFTGADLLCEDRVKRALSDVLCMRRLRAQIRLMIEIRRVQMQLL